MLFLHLVAAAFWLGGMMLLAVVAVTGLRTLDRESFARLMRGAGWTFAVGSVIAWAVLGVTGLFMAREHISTVAQLSTTTFGQRLSVKLVLAAVALLGAVAHTVTGRSKSRPLLMVSRTLAIVVFLATLGVFYQATQLGV